MKKYMAFVLALLLALPLALSPAAAQLPDLPKDQYVVDDAGVLSQTTVSAVTEANDALTSSGAQIGVLTVRYTGSSTTEQYAYDVFNTWGIGDSKKNNGVLLLLVIDGDDYWCQQGQGLVKSGLPTSTISTILEHDCEPGFAAGDYDKAVVSTVNAIRDKLADFYGITIQPASDPEPTTPLAKPNTGGRLTSKIGDFLGKGVLLLLLLLIVLFIITRPRRDSGFGSGSGPGFWSGLFLGSLLGSRTRRRTPPSPPPGSMGSFGGPFGGLNGHRSGMGSGPRPRSGGSRSMGGGRSSFGSGSHGGGRSMGGSRSMGGGRSFGGGAGRRR